MTSLAARLDGALRLAGVAITGVSVGDDTDRATWKVQPPSVQVAAQPILDAFTLPTVAQIEDEDAQRDINDKKLQAVAVALWECIPAPTMTKAQMKTRAIAVYKSL